MNDERPIEKLLRRAAKKRGDESGVPPELQPANRRLLQDEVARQFPPAKAPQREVAPPFWVALTRRWAYALALIPVIGLLALVVLPSLSKSKSKGNMELAKQTAAKNEAMPAALADESFAAPSTAMPAAVTLTASDSANSVGAITPGVSGTGNSVEAITLGASGAGNFSGGGNIGNLDGRVLVPAITAPAPAALPAVASKSQPAARREIADEATVGAGRLTEANVNQPTPERANRRAEEARADATAHFYSRTTSTYGVAAAAPQSPPTASARSGTKETTPAAAVREQETLAVAINTVTNNSQVAFDSLTATTVVPGSASGVVTLDPDARMDRDSYADKAWLARGGGADRQRSVLNSQAFANLGVPAEAKRKDVRAEVLIPPVLQNFQVQQQGRDLRIVDGDGSIYKGVVDEANTLYKQMSARQEQKLAIANDSKFNLKPPKQQTEAVSAVKKLEAQAYYLYRVEGTNRTLNQNVVFTWNFLDTNALAAGTLNYQNVAQQLDATKLPSQFPAVLQNSFINGRAQFGAGRAIEVNAVPVQP